MITHSALALGTRSTHWSAIFQDFALGMFSFWCRGDWVHPLYCTRPEPKISSLLWGMSKEFLLFSCLFLFPSLSYIHCLPGPPSSSLLSHFILFCASFRFLNPLNLFCPSSYLFLLPRSVHAPLFLSLELFSLSVAFPIPLPLICVLSLPQSQIIPSLWNWKIAAGESKREIILSD